MGQEKNIDTYLKFQHPQVGEIWWCSVGVNIGTEVYGKGSDYSRPVLVVNNKGSESVIGIPLTSKLKNKKFSYIIDTQLQLPATALIYQLRSFNKRRFIKRMDKITLESLVELKIRIMKLF